MNTGKPANNLFTETPKATTIMNAGLKKEIAMNKSFSTFRHLAGVALFASLMVSLLPAAEAAAKSGKAGKAALGPARWEETIRKFETADASVPPPKGAVLLIGGSNARRWTDVGDYFPKHQVINRGFGGAQLTDVLHFADRIVLPYAPKTILLNAGGNDLSAGKSPEQVRDAARAFATQVHATLPDTRIYCLGLPRVRRADGAPEVLAAIRSMNGLLAELARTEKNFEFIDLFPAFLDDQGRYRPDLFVEDGTHFSPKGYAVLAGLLRGKF
jgi:lysophospholipase L1-like esterase